MNCSGSGPGGMETRLVSRREVNKGCSLHSTCSSPFSTTEDAETDPRAPADPADFADFVDLVDVVG